ncbi:MAG: hypothetical protein WDN08_20960 [Rhizomicrobium sp.]
MLVEDDPADQKARQHEEHVDAQRGEFEQLDLGQDIGAIVPGDDEQDGHAAQAVERDEPSRRRCGAGGRCIANRKTHL